MKRTFLALALALSVTACLSSGAAFAKGGKEDAGAHSCCPAPQDGAKAPDQAPEAGAKCCIVLPVSKVTHAVLLKAGLHDCDAPAFTAWSPAIKSARAVVPAPRVFHDLLVRLILSIRAPPAA